MSNDAPACKNCAHVEEGHTCGFLAKATPGPEDKTTKVSERPSFNRNEATAVFLIVLLGLIIWSPLVALEVMRLKNALHPPRPNFFIRLVSIEGFDPQASVLVPPTFHLAVDVDGVVPYYNACNGGAKSMLHVSYHGIILAWGNVPHFCINGELIERADRVVTIEAKAEGAVLREEIRSLVWSEKQTIGKAEFDLEGDVTGLGSLSCKVIYSSGHSRSSRTLCMIQ